MQENHGFQTVRPVLTERHCGGWLAITPTGWPLGIGVTADTRGDAEKKFQDELERFSKIQEHITPVRQCVRNETPSEPNGPSRSLPRSGEVVR